jgi:DNA-binding CsgD family transcriptional regulator
MLGCTRGGDSTLANVQHAAPSRRPAGIPVETRQALALELRQLSLSIPEALAEISLPVFVVDRHGTLRWENAAAIALFGNRKGEHFNAFFAAEAQQDAREKFVSKMIGGARTTSYKSTLVAQDGRRFEGEVESVRLDDGHRAVGVFGIVGVERFADPPAAATTLTPRKLQVLKLLANGCSTDSIAQELHISRETVRNHVRDLLRELGVHSRLQAVVRAHELGIG